MAEGFDERGLPPRIVTSHGAELDFVVLGLSEARIAGIARSLREIGVSNDDDAVDAFTVRRIGDLDVAFARSIHDGVYTVTVFSVRAAGAEPSLARLLKGLEVVAMLRRVTGL